MLCHQLRVSESGLCHNPIHDYCEQSNTSLHTEPFTSVTIGSDCAFAVLVEILQNKYDLFWKTVHPEDYP